MDALSPTVAIDLDALAANFDAVKAAAPAAECGAVVKCNAYGLGAAQVGKKLADAGCKTFFVTYAQEGVALRKALGSGREAVIYVFNGPNEESLPAFRDFRLKPVLNGAEQARLWAGRSHEAAALHVDTGMNRLGAAQSEIAAIAAIDGLKIDLFMSHLACASDPAHPMNDRQRQAFVAAASNFPKARLSLSASGGAFLAREFHFDLVRAGIALYGASPFDRPHPRLKPVARLTAPVVQLREVNAGETVGYGATRAFSAPAKLATVALGYGDGFLRAAGNRGAAWLGGALCPIVGRVSMDLMVLDASGAREAVKIGDRAEFFGPNLAIEDAAATAGTIAYELLTDLGPRIARRYLSCERELRGPERA